MAFLAITMPNLGWIGFGGLSLVHPNLVHPGVDLPVVVHPGWLIKICLTYLFDLYA